MPTLAQPQFAAPTPEPLSFLARAALGSVPPPQIRSLSVQLANTIALLAEHLAVRGESSLQHYYAEALTLKCFGPRSNDVAEYELLLRGFVQFDRRRPLLPRLIEPGSLAVDEAHAVHFVQALGDQASFQPIYEAARQLDRYGPIARPVKKMERIILFAREIAGQSLLAARSAPEELYGRICESSG
ncbi:MAG: hypothetical protein AABO58_03940 [Acidobacteriota bacterium]